MKETKATQMKQKPTCTAVSITWKRREDDTIVWGLE